MILFCFFFFNDTATTEIYTLSLHDALPILPTTSSTESSITGNREKPVLRASASTSRVESPRPIVASRGRGVITSARSEEHTSELQSRQYLVCRLLLEKKKKTIEDLSEPLLE